MQDPKNITIMHSKVHETSMSYARKEAEVTPRVSTACLAGLIKNLRATKRNRPQLWTPRWQTLLDTYTAEMAERKRRR